MVGLSVVLEGNGNNVKNKISQVINKTTMNMMVNKPPSPSSSSSNPSISQTNLSQSYSTYLDQCFLCKQKLLPGFDIYMYKSVLYIIS